MGLGLLALLCLAPGPGPATPVSYLCAPAYSLDKLVRGPLEPYTPQPGDIFLSTDQELWARGGHWLAGGAGVHHSAILFARPDGRVALIEAGPFNSVTVEVVDPIVHMSKHVAAGDCVWVRRRRVPLTPEQSARLTAFACAQEGKPFAVGRMLRQVTPFRTRGPLRTWLLGKPHGDRDKYFCSELVTESCCFAGLMDPATTRPSATYPRDLFFGASSNPYLNRHLNLDDWCPPARWLPAGLVPAGR